MSFEASGHRQGDRSVGGYALASAGILLIVTASWWAELLSSLLPLGWKVMSAGTQYPGFDDAFPSVLRGMGAALVVGAVVHGVTRRGWLPLRRGWALAVMSRWGVALVALVSAVVYGCLARPHYGFPSNARIHWVEIFFSRRDDYFYTLVKLPHMLFYDAPWLLMAVNGGLNVVLVGVIVRRLATPWWAPPAAALSYLVSAQMLLFANSAEDVQLAVTSLLLVVLAHVARRPIPIAVALFVAMLARPSFLLLVPAMLLAEILTADGGRGWRAVGSRLGAVLRDRSVFPGVLLFGGAAAIWHLWLGWRGVGWVGTDGRLVSSPLFDLAPRAVDGFTISAFSGAFAGHALWLSPLVVVLATWGLVRARELPAAVRSTVWMVAFFVVASILLLEAMPLYYFNIRYLAYLYPLGLVLAWVTVARMPAWRVGPPLVAAMATVLALSGAAGPHRELEIRETIADEPLASLYPHRQRLRTLVADQSVQVDVGRLQRQNLVAYILRRPLDALVPVDGDAASVGTGWLVTDDPDLVPRAEVVVEGDGVRLVRVGPEDLVDA